MCWESPDGHKNLNLAGALVFPGLTLPDLAARLRGSDGPEAHRRPHDARLLRALVAPGEDDIGPAVERYARLGGYAPSPAGFDRPLAHEAIHQEMLDLLRAMRHEALRRRPRAGRPGRTHQEVCRAARRRTAHRRHFRERRIDVLATGPRLHRR